MTLAEGIVLISCVLVTGVLARPVASLLRLPYAGLLLVIGFAGSELIVASGVDTGLRWYHFRELVFYLLIPIVVFETSQRVDLRALGHLFGLIVILAVPAMLATLCLAAVIIHWLIGYPETFTLVICLLAGSIVVAVDPTSINQALNESPNGRRVAAVLEGESLLGDVTAIVMFSLFLGLALMNAAQPKTHVIVMQFALVLLGGLGLGAAVALVVDRVIGWLSMSSLRSIVVLASVYTLFVSCELWVNISGVAAVLTFGIVLKRLGPADIDGRNELLTFFRDAVEIVIYVTAGATFTLYLFGSQYLAMCIGALAAVSSRFIVVWLATTTWNSWCASTNRMDRRERVLIALGGERGLVCLALALSLPLELEAWLTVQAIAYGAVLFSIFVQTPLQKRLVAKV